MQVFISYAKEDFATADVLREFLEQRLVPSFLAPRSIKPGHVWRAEIEKHLAESDVLLLLWSKNSKESPWVHYELSAAMIMEKRIVPCALDNTAFHPLMSRTQVLYWRVGDQRGSLAELAAGLGIGPDSAVAPGRDEITPTSHDAIGAYREALLREHRDLMILGGGKGVAIEEAYLPLRVRPRGSVPKDTVIDAYGLLQHGEGRIVVLGHPGTGKTTLLRYVAFRCAKEPEALLPVYVKAARAAQVSSPMVEYTRNIIQGLTNRTLAAILTEDDAFGREDTLLLLDGFDEIPEDGRSSFVARLDEFLTAHPRCRVAVTSRVSSFDEQYFAPLGFAFYQLSALGEDDIRGYISRYAPEMTRQRLWEAVRSSERLYELAQVPFMLAMICAAGSGLDTVVDRASLFRACTHYLLATRKGGGERGAAGPGELDDADRELEDALKAAAVRFFKLDTRDAFDKDDVEFAVRKVAQTVSPAEIIGNIVAQTGLLQRSGTEYYFIHRSIWEYYVAVGMRDEPLDRLLDRALVPAWEEPIRLYVGLCWENELADTVRGVWGRNRGLALRSLAELPVFPEQLLRELVFGLDRGERVRLVFEVIDTAKKSTSRTEQRRILLDSLSALLRVETDCEVIYNCVLALEEFDDPACHALVRSTLDLDNADRRRERYLASRDHRFELVPIPAGQFTMGLDASPDEREKPAHRVILSPFEMGRYLVVNFLYYDAFPFAVDRRDVYSGSGNQPANNVSWFEAQVFAWWLGCDLPTEAEWEYACRAGGRDDDVLFDPTKLDEYAWYVGNSDNRTHEVGEKRQNSFGLYDMLGNVREWVKDWYSDKQFYEYCFEQGAVTDPLASGGSDRKVLRGGVFDWATTNLRPTYRPMNPPDNVFFGNGFRVVYRKDKPVPYLQAGWSPEAAG
jgi:hypothetical protein